MILRTLARPFAVQGDALPTEFCIFRPGVNESTKGPTLFDAKAAQAVMAEYERQGVELCIDLEHHSLKPATRADSADARGWFKLELRSDGSLWAVDVRWTPDGARRLQEKTQRYISPAFTEDEDRRPTWLANCALCAMPATYDAAPLVAASRLALARRDTRGTVSRSNMDPDQIKAALDAIEAGDAAKAIELLKGIIASAASGGAAPSAPDAGAAPDAAAESADVAAKALTKVLAEKFAALKASEGAAVTLSKDFCKALGKETSAEALAELTSLVARVAKIDSERATVELAKRSELVAELVKLGIETPATAWEKDGNGAPVAGKPCKRLSSEPVAEMTERVAALRVGRPAPVTPPTATSGEITTLSAEQKATCRRAKISEADFIARRNAVSVRRL